MSVEEHRNPDEGPLLETLRFESKAALSLLVAVALVSAYLLQRTGQILVFGLDPLSPQPQASQIGLEFSYLTLSVAWPIVLGVLCTSCDFVARKRLGILKELNNRGLATADVALLDPLYFTLPRTLSLRLLLWLLGLAPVTSIALVFGAQLSVTVSRFLEGHADITLTGYHWIPVDIWVLLNLVVQCLAVGVGVTLTWSFGGTLTVMVRKQ
jgi:hypothetical protein